MRFIKRYFGTIFSLGLLGFALWGWLNRLAIYDWFRLRSYDPPALITQLAADTTMSGAARHLFYVQHPQVEDKSTFNSHCPQGEQTIVLGCYVSKQGIFIYDVTDVRLEGIEQVTAAHELLHAAYERLSPDKRRRLGEQLDEVFSSLNNDRIRQTIEQYRSSGADITNELHSILATEVRELPADLEKYYSQYFKDRLQVVAYSENYEKTFVDLKAQVAAYDQELDALKKQVETNEASLATQSSAIEAERNRLDTLLANNQIAAYNAAIPAFNSSIRSYNALVNQTKELINTYNSKLELRNTLALQEQELFKAIDSRLNVEETQ